MKKLRAGFTLLEVLLSVAILALLTGSVYGVIHAALVASDDLYTEQANQMSDSALAELLRKNFASLPALATLSLKVQPNGGRPLAEIALTNAPGAFTWGHAGWHDGPLLLRTGIGGDGSIHFVIQRLSEENASKSQPGEEIDLAGGFQEFYWEFYNNRDQKWEGEWVNKSENPALVKLAFRRKGDPLLTEMTFAFPWSSARPDPLPANVSTGG